MKVLDWLENTKAIDCYCKLRDQCEILLNWPKMTKMAKRLEQKRLEAAADFIPTLRAAVCTTPTTSQRDNVLRALDTANRIFTLFRGSVISDCAGREFSQMLSLPAVSQDLRDAYQRLRDTATDFQVIDRESESQAEVTRLMSKKEIADALYCSEREVPVRLAGALHQTTRQKCRINLDKVQDPHDANLIRIYLVKNPKSPKGKPRGKPFKCRPCAN